MFVSSCWVSLALCSRPKLRGLVRLIGQCLFLRRWATYRCSAREEELDGAKVPEILAAILAQGKIQIHCRSQGNDKIMLFHCPQLGHDGEKPGSIVFRPLQRIGRISTWIPWVVMIMLVWPWNDSWTRTKAPCILYEHGVGVRDDIRIKGLFGEPDEEVENTTTVAKTLYGR